MPSPNPTTRREYKEAAVATSLNGGINGTANSFVINDNSGWPTGAVGNFIVTIDRGLGTEERILCSAQSGKTVTVAASGRGFNGTTAQSHANGATVECTGSAFDFDEFNAHTAATSAVHGITGSVVGTTDTQTLSAKTLTTPTIGSFVNANHAHVDGASGGSITRHLVQASRSASSSALTSGSWTGLTWDTNDVDTDSFHSTVTNPSRITVPVSLPGKYRFRYRAVIGGLASGNQVLTCLTKNGAAVATATNQLGLFAANASGANVTAIVEFITSLAANDYLEAFVNSNATSPTILGNGTAPLASFFAAEFLGP